MHFLHQTNASRHRMGKICTNNSSTCTYDLRRYFERILFRPKVSTVMYFVVQIHSKTAACGAGECHASLVGWLVGWSWDNVLPNNQHGDRGASDLGRILLAFLIQTRTVEYTLRPRALPTIDERFSLLRSNQSWKMFSSRTTPLTSSSTAL